MGRKLVVLRHGERLDNTFGLSWVEHCFDRNGVYTKNNLNMPDRMIQRSNFLEAFLEDTPLTQIGEFQGVLVGKGLKDVLKPGFKVYTSPALRSIQTATGICAGMGNPLGMPVRIEPGLFEWTGYCEKGLPEFTTAKELIAHSYNIDTNYKPFIGLEDLQVPETVQHYYARTHELVCHLLAADGDNDIVLVAHGSSAHTATLQLIGGAPLDKGSLVSGDVPYACVAVAEHDEARQKWSLCEPGNLTMTHGSNHYFNCAKEFQSS